MLGKVSFGKDTAIILWQMRRRRVQSSKYLWRFRHMLTDNVYLRLVLVLAVYAAVYYAAVTFVCRKTTLNEIIKKILSLWK